jgi:DNA-binding NarL/FixJ family response regulator
VVIVDLRLTGSRCTGGLVLIGDFRASGAVTPVVLLTSSASTGIVCQAMDSGAAAVLFKSSVQGHIREVVARLLPGPPGP